jgi:hypothetical protein
MALAAIAPAAESHGHAVIMGQARSGRTSTLREVARRAQAERGRLVVRLRPSAAQTSHADAFLRHLLVAAVEEVAAASPNGKPDWHAAWRERVYLRNRGPVTDGDQLSTGLVLAADPGAELDAVLVERDLSWLGACAIEYGASGVVLVLDDATELTADTGLVEQLISGLDAVGGWSLLMSGFPATAAHFQEAASPCLRRFRPVFLGAFSPADVVTCLSAPLEPAERERLLDGRNVALLRDLVRLTSGNPHEVILVANRMWQACSLGETEKLALTPSVLDRVVSDLAVYTGGDDLRDGAIAIRRLASEQIDRAIELVAFSNLTLREIAVARALGVSSRDASVVRRDATPEIIANQLDRVHEEVLELERAGVIAFSADEGSSTVQGGRAASVLLKYQARARSGPQVTDRPFGLGFLFIVGRALLRDAFRTTVSALEGATPLGSDVTEIASTATTLRSPRLASTALARDRTLDALARGDLKLSLRSKESFERLLLLVAAPTGPRLALVTAAVADAETRLEYAELWELSPETDQEHLTQELAAATDSVMSIFELADLRWQGTEGSVFQGELARKILVLLAPAAAILSVGELFADFRADGDDTALARATELAELSVDAFRAPELEMFKREIYLSPMLSRAGFLVSLDRERLDDATALLNDALNAGDGESWATHWNLANVSARRASADLALAHLDDAAKAAEATDDIASVSLFLPDVEPTASLITVAIASFPAVLELQRAVIRHVLRGDALELVQDAVGLCLNVGDDGAREAAALATRSFLAVGPMPGA